MYTVKNAKNCTENTLIYIRFTKELHNSFVTIITQDLQDYPELINE